MWRKKETVLVEGIKCGTGLSSRGGGVCRERLTANWAKDVTNSPRTIFKSTKAVKGEGKKVHGEILLGGKKTSVVSSSGGGEIEEEKKGESASWILNFKGGLTIKSKLYRLSNEINRISLYGK